MLPPASPMAVLMAPPGTGGNWVSSRKPGDIPAFNREMIDVFGQRMRDSVRGTPRTARSRWIGH